MIILNNFYYRMFITYSVLKFFHYIETWLISIYIRVSIYKIELYIFNVFQIIIFLNFLQFSKNSY